MPADTFQHRPLAAELDGTVTVVDWSRYPEPFCWIGPQFRRECEAIAAGNRAPLSHRERMVDEIKQRREALGVSQYDLARAAGYGVAVTNAFESGFRYGEGTYRRLSAALDRLEALEAERASREASDAR